MIEDEIAEAIKSLIVRMLPSLQPATTGVLSVSGSPGAWNCAVAIEGIDPSPLAVPPAQWFSTFKAEITAAGSSLAGRTVRVDFVDRKPMIMGTVG